jgi:hypothetical protein
MVKTLPQHNVPGHDFRADGKIALKIASELPI